MPSNAPRGRGVLPFVLLGATVLVLIVSSVGVACGGGDGENGRATVGFAGGTVSLEGGPEIEIPAGAIANDISFTIDKSAQKVSLPEGFKAVGNVYEIGPEGTNFSVPVRITLPIPEGEDPADVVGVVTMDPDSGEWVGVSSSVDAEARTVSAYTTHLSPWGIVGGRSEAAKTGGWIKVTNTHARGSGSFPTTGFGGSSCKAKPVYLENLVCFTTYTPNNPPLLMKPSLDVVIARDQTTVEYWLPAGTYVLEDSKFASEINDDPSYSPCFDWWTRPPQTIVLTPGQTVEFGQDLGVPPSSGSSFVRTPNSCAPVPKPTGTPTATSTGTPRATSTATPKATATATPAATLTATPVATLVATPEPTLTATPAVTPTATPSPAVEEQIFKVLSIGVAYNGATTPTTFSINESWLVTYILTYHWNNGNGVTPGTIGLRASDGTTYGPWQATGETGQGGVLNASWVVRPNVVIPPGAYTVVDSDPSTWAQNDETGGAGMSWANGIRQ
jgi:hypothetical protein